MFKSALSGKGIFYFDTRQACQNHSFPSLVMIGPRKIVKGVSEKDTLAVCEYEGLNYFISRIPIE